MPKSGHTAAEDAASVVEDSSDWSAPEHAAIGSNAPNPQAARIRRRSVVERGPLW
jgi:hypothetical protein